MAPIKQLEIKASIHILKPTHEVFEAIVNPVKMSNYFIAKGSERMIQGSAPIWKFPEFDEEFAIKVEEIIENKFISFFWEVNTKNMLVEIKLSEGTSSGATLVTVTEQSMPNDEDGIKWLKGNTEGWANFLACLKAYLEYGINLRKGAFDHLIPK